MEKPWLYYMLYIQSLKIRRPHPKVALALVKGIWQAQVLYYVENNKYSMNPVFAELLCETESVSTDSHHNKNETLYFKYSCRAK